MYQQTINSKTLNSNRMDPPEYVINGCMKQHMFDYKPEKEYIMCREFLSDCENCQKFNFEEYMSEEDVSTHHDNWNE